MGKGGRQGKGKGGKGGAVVIRNEESGEDERGEGKKTERERGEGTGRWRATGGKGTRMGNRKRWRGKE